MRTQKLEFLVVSIFHIFRIILVLANMRHAFIQSYLTLFLVTLFFLELISCKKDRRDPCTKSSSLYCSALMNKFICKFFGSIHLRLEMQQQHIAGVSVLLSILSIHIHFHKKIERFSCLLLHSDTDCQWRTTLFCQVKPPLRVNKAQMESQDLE